MLRDSKKMLEEEADSGPAWCQREYPTMSEPLKVAPGPTENELKLQGGIWRFWYFLRTTATRLSTDPQREGLFLLVLSFCTFFFSWSPGLLVSRSAGLLVAWSPALLPPRCFKPCKLFQNR